MGKSESETKRVVHENGKIVIVQSEERFPYSTEILMNSGFSIILLNMTFGLLPTTLYGTRLKYLRCSVAQLYAFAFGLCMVILSGLFLPVVLKSDLASSPTDSKGTSQAIMALIRFTHVCGFLLLVIRGCWIAKKAPRIWNQLAKLVQMAIVDLHGRKYHYIKRITSFGRHNTAFYLIVLIINQTTEFINELDHIRPQFLFHYKLFLLEDYLVWNGVMFTIGFTIWQLCSLSHVLVSILSGFFVVSITVCLRGVMEHLVGLFNQNNTKDNCHPLLIGKRATVKVKESFELELNDDDEIADSLNKVKEVMVVAENLTEYISKILGFSLIVEVLILIANMLVNVFYILIQIKPNNNSTDEKEFPFNPTESSGGSEISYYSPMGDTLQLVTDAFIHSYFFFRLCWASNQMVNEAKQPLQFLKTIKYNKYSKKIQDAIQTLKSDLASTTITLTANNYFQINKFLITSVAGSLTTYIVVLLQFHAQEQSTKV